MRGALRWLALIATIGMGLVLLQGTLVTNTNSQYGCGNTWPLCRGKIIPELKDLEAVSTLIEFSHRVVVPIESTLIIALAAGLLWYHRGRREARYLAPGLIVFLFLQALLGGLAVMFPTSPGVLALHFGVSLLAFASTALALAFLWEMEGGEAIRDRPLAGSLRWLIWATLGYVYIVVYSGAYVRHVNASLSCLDWPLCNGALIPHMMGGVQAQFDHRVAALASTVLIAVLYLQTRRYRFVRPDLHLGGAAALLLVVLQALSGGLVVMSRLYIYTTLLHSLLVSLLFGVLSYLCFHTLPLPRRKVAESRSTERGQNPAATVARPVRT